MSKHIKHTVLCELATGQNAADPGLITNRTNKYIARYEFLRLEKKVSFCFQPRRHFTGGHDGESRKGRSVGEAVGCVGGDKLHWWFINSAYATNIIPYHIFIPLIICRVASPIR